jgi:XTP/dITP diphosphohydrolase
VAAAGLPADLIPDTITSVTVSVDSDAENTLRSAVLEFMDTVRRVEHAIAAGRRGEDVPEELDVATLGDISEQEWRDYWTPVVVDDTEPAPDEAQAEDTEPAPDRIPEPTPADVPEPTPVEVPEPAPVEVPEPAPTEPAPEDVSTEEALREARPA